MKRTNGIGIGIGIVLGVVALVGCGEKPQTAGAKRVDAQAFEGTENPYAMAGWKSGDRASWEAQMRARTQNQNEYTRAK